MDKARSLRERAFVCVDAELSEGSTTVSAVGLAGIYDLSVALFTAIEHRGIRIDHCATIHAVTAVVQPFRNRTEMIADWISFGTAVTIIGQSSITIGHGDLHSSLMND
jgi:hypothetical protein